MDQQTDTDLDQTDEDILTYTVSDEALEAAAGTGSCRGHGTGQVHLSHIHGIPRCCP
jgi:hypothetical protein